MKAAVAQGKKRGLTFSENYASTLEAYLRYPDETALRQAYEMGRDAMVRGTSLGELVLTHQEALLLSLRKRGARNRIDQVASSASEFLSEVLSPYEMAQRGFQEAVSALRRMNELLEQEIKRIAYAVHDEAGQLLTAVHLALANLQRESAPKLKSDFDNIKVLLKQVETQLRQYSHELRPTILDDLGLIPALRFLANSISVRSALPINVSAATTERFSPAVEIALYRVLQEALSNVTRHARASSVFIEISHDDNLLVCKVQDDGIGFDVSLAQRAGRRSGLGLTSMKERVNSIGGTMEFDSSSGRGACLVVRVPISPMESKNAHAHPSRG